MTDLLKNRTIRTKLLAAYSAAFLLVIALVGVLVFNVVLHSLESNLDAELACANHTTKTMTEGAIDLAIQTQLKRIADRNRDQVELCYQQCRRGFLAEGEAKSRARKLLLAERIGLTGYTYCIDSKGITTVHPVAEAIGSNSSEYAFIQRQIEQKSGYLEYDLHSPDEVSAQPKALYMTYFEPWDWIISASAYRQEFVGMLDLDIFRTMVLATHFNQSGYTYIVDYGGNVVIHPQLAGNHLETEDAEGFRFIEHICREKRGRINYQWRDAGSDRVREKIAVFDNIPELGWIVVSSHYPEEVYAPMQNLRTVLAMAICLGLALFLAISIYISNSLTSRLNDLQAAFGDGVNGDYSTRVTPAAEDEIGQLGHYFNSFMTQLEASHDFLRREVQDRRRAEAQARKNENRFRTFLNTAKEGCVEMDAEGTILDLNPEFCVLLGRPETELVGKNIFDIIPNLGDQSKLRRLLKSPVPMEVDVIRPNDSAVHVLINATGIRDEDGELNAIFGIVTDINDLRRATSQLRATQFTLDSASVPVFWIGPQARLLYANDAACQSLGYSRLELLGMSAKDISSVFKPDNWQDTWRQVSEQGSLHLGTRFQTRDAQRFPVELSLNHVTFSDADYVCAFAMDISERTIAEEKLCTLNDELEQRVEKRTAELKNTLDIMRNTQQQLVESEKMAALGNLVAGVAHEINTPVGISVTAASHLRDKTNHYMGLFGKSELRRSDLESFLTISSESANIIMNNLERAAELIASFKQVAVDQSSLEHRNFNLKSYIGDAITSLRPRWKKTNHTLELTGDDNLDIDSYPGVFSQIITNLTLNTLLHGFENIDVGRIDIDVRRENDMIVIRFSDDGVGIPRSHVKKLFEPFFTTKRGHGGSGLGLHIVYNLVHQKLGGTIDCESSPGDGTTFTIQVPLTRETQHVEAPEEQSV